ncbi:MAG: hypothetical protein ACPL1F_02980, partial [bacterium]
MKLKEPINFLYKLSSHNFLDEFNNSKDTFLKYEDIISLLLSNYKDVKIFLIKKLKDFISQDNLLNKMNYTLLFFNTYSVLMDSE